jgi:hypothetical protein
MKHAGRSPEQISQELQVAFEVLKRFLPQETQESDASATAASERKPIHFASMSIPEELKEPPPQFIYCCKDQTSQLLRTNLLTGGQSSAIKHLAMSSDMAVFGVSCLAEAYL